MILFSIDYPISAVITGVYVMCDRAIKIYRLCSVMGIEDIYDPDEEYELTTDNVKKILAIHMRLR